MKRKILRSLKKRKKIFQRQIFWVAIFFFCFFYGLFFLFYLSPVFTLKDIELNSNDEILGKKIMMEFKLGLNLIFFNPKKEELFLKNKYIELKEISIKKKLPSILKIDVIKREPLFIFCSKDKNECFLSDEDGFLFDRASNQNLFKIYFPYELSLGQIILGKEKIFKIFTIVSQIKQASLNPYEAEVLDDRFKVLIPNQTFLFFDLDKEVNWQLEKLFTFLNQNNMIKKINELEYIDLRFKDFIYYKYNKQSD